MEYTIEGRVTATAFAIAFDNAEEIRRRFVEKFNKEAPPRRTILYWKDKLLETGNLANDRPKSGRPITASGDGIKAKVIQHVKSNPSTSIRVIANEIGVSVGTVQNILHKERYHPYKPLYSQFLCDADDDRRLHFCEEMLAKFQNDPAFYRKVTFSDECVFHLKGHVNKHNVHYWGLENPNIRFQHPGQTSSLTVWACIGYNGLISYEISTATMNAERYCAILTNNVLPYFQRNTNRDKYFQHDGAAAHFS